MNLSLACNSSSLQNRFPDIYRNFFSNSQTVVSGHYYFSWNGYSLNTNAELSINQKLPCKIYLSLIQEEPKKLIFDQAYIYLEHEHNFINLPISDYISSGSIKYFKKEYEPLLNNSGFRIKVLSELPQGLGLNFEDNFVTILVITILLQLQKIKPTCPLWHNVAFDSNYAVQKILNEIKKVNHALSKSLNPLPLIFDYRLPLVNFSNTKEHSVFRFAQKFNLEETKTWPLDFGIVYSGINHKAELTNQKQLDDKASSLFKELKLMDLPSANTVYMPYLNNFADFKLLDRFADLFSNGYELNKIDSIIDSLNQIRHLKETIIEPSYYMKQLFKDFAQMSQNGNLLSELALLPLCIPKIGGSFLFAAPIGMQRKKIIKTIATLKEKYDDLSLIYASFRDGYAESGLKIEQMLSENIYADFVKACKYQIKICEATNSDTNYTDNYNNIQKYYKNTDLILNKLEKKIYIRDTSLTSKELHSQSATIEILAALLNSPNKTVSNKQLPRSSYSRNLNEIRGKIIYPLKKIIKQKTDHDLDLKCTGTINDFQLKLSLAELSIAIINKSTGH